ncbi:MAG: hypothetical protein ABI210_05805 [Abditibacteriaceae bacterium]
MNDKKSIGVLVIVAKSLFVLLMGIQLFASYEDILSGNFFYITSLLFLIECAILFSVLIIFAAIKFLRRNQKKKEQSLSKQSVNCALWWGCTGIAYLFTGYVFTLIGFIFLIFSLFIWANAIRLVLSDHAKN